MSGWKRLYLVFIIISMLASITLIWVELDRQYSKSAYHVTEDTFNLPLETTYRVCLKDSSHETYSYWVNKFLDYYGSDSPHHNPQKLKPYYLFDYEFKDLKYQSYESQELPVLDIVWAMDLGADRIRYNRHTASHRHCDKEENGYSYSWAKMTLGGKLVPVSDLKVVIQIVLYILGYFLFFSVIPSALLYFIFIWVRKGFLKSE